jgi:hypothetical protein
LFQSVQLRLRKSKRHLKLVTAITEKIAMDPCKARRANPRHFPALSAYRRIRVCQDGSLCKFTGSGFLDSLGIVIYCESPTNQRRRNAPGSHIEE